MRSENLPPGAKPRSNKLRLTSASILLCFVAGCSVRQRMNDEFFKYRGVVDRTPAAAGMVYEDLTIRVESRTLQGWYVSPTSPSDLRSAVLIFHGAGETISDWIPVLKYLTAHGIAAMVFDYSAFGNSTGEREYSNLARDGSAALTLFCKKAGQGASRYLLGYSMGAGVMLEAAAVGSTPSVDGVIVMSGWQSWRGWLSDTGRVPSWLCWVMPDIFNNESKLRTIPVPVLIVHGDVDEMIPLAHAQRLYRATVSRARLQVVKGLGHRVPLDGELDGYWKPVTQFLTERRNIASDFERSPIVPSASDRRTGSGVQKSSSQYRTVRK
jgi:uncharacterized protein